MKFEHRSTQGNVELRAHEDETPSIEGLGAVYYDGSERTEFVMFGDRSGEHVVERIMPGAFDSVVDSDVYGLFNHDMNMILGRTKSGTMTLRTSEAGLHYSISQADTSVYRDVSLMLERGDLDGSSFGFRIEESDEEWETNGDQMVRSIHNIAMLRDVGPVAGPAYTATTAEARSRFDAVCGRKAIDSQWRQRILDLIKIGG